jgi:hypothetical protein
VADTTGSKKWQGPVENFGNPKAQLTAANLRGSKPTCCYKRRQ